MASIYSKEYKELVHKLREARKQSGLTQSLVAQLLKKPQSFVSKIESGKRRVDPIELLALSRIYNKNTSFFLTK